MLGRGWFWKKHELPCLGNAGRVKMLSKSSYGNLDLQKLHSSVIWEMGNSKSEEQWNMLEAKFRNRNYGSRKRAQHCQRFHVRLLNPHMLDGWRSPRLHHSMEIFSNSKYAWENDKDCDHIMDGEIHCKCFHKNLLASLSLLRKKKYSGYYNRLWQNIIVQRTMSRK